MKSLGVKFEFWRFDTELFIDGINGNFIIWQPNKKLDLGNLFELFNIPINIDRNKIINIPGDFSSAAFWIGLLFEQL